MCRCGWVLQAAWADGGAAAVPAAVAHCHWRALPLVAVGGQCAGLDPWPRCVHLNHPAVIFSWQVRVPAAGQQPVVFGAIKRGDTAAGLAAGASAGVPRFAQLHGVTLCGWKPAIN